MQTIGKYEKRELWILDSVVLNQWSIASLLSPKLEALFNRNHHGLSPTDLISLFQNLANQEEVVFEVATPGSGLTDFDPTSNEQWDLAFSGKIRIRYGLSSKGGYHWEQWFEPQWGQFISTSCGFDPPIVLVEASSIGLAHKYAQLESFYWGDIIQNSQTIEKLVPWQATYWKKLPLGYQLHLEYSPIGADEYRLISDTMQAELANLRTWHKEIDW